MSSCMTIENAIEFLQDSWHMDDVLLQLQINRENFLNKLIMIIQERVPFHTLFAFMSPAWKVTDLTDVDNWCMSGVGGHCGVINTFTWRLLTALGFNAYLCLATVTKSTSINPHFIVIVKDLTKTGDVHVVDCGLGQPSFRAVSLNFSKESQVYQDSFLEYKYIKQDGMFLRMHGKGDLMMHNNPPKCHDYYQGKWRRYYVFNLERLPCKSLDDIMRFIDVRGARMEIDVPRAASFSGNKAVMFFSKTLFILQDDGTLKQKKMKSYEEILRIYEKHFPTIPKDTIHQAYSRWHKIQSKI